MLGRPAIVINVIILENLLVIQDGIYTLETNLHLTLCLHELGRIDFWSRPAVLVLLLLTAGALLLPMLPDRLGISRSGSDINHQEQKDDDR